MRIVGLDLGTKTCGVAITDKLGMLANPLKTIRYDNEDNLLKELDIIINDEVSTIVLGLPKNMNNTITIAGERSLRFKEILESRYHKEVVLVDERLSTKEAENVLIDGDISRMKRKKVIDTLAATIILESYLNRKR